MFSGIVEAVGEVLRSESAAGLIRVWVTKPEEFDDLKIGDSIATNGICLTVEQFDAKTIVFALAAETLRVLGLDPQKTDLKGVRWNLERSLRFGDRIHGHLVTGHVDSLGQVVRRELQGESLFLDVKVKDSVLPFVWTKGSVTINGTSLTVNSLEGNTVSVCLIPETLKRTNLNALQVGHSVTIEPDYVARALTRSLKFPKRSDA